MGRGRERRGVGEGEEGGRERGEEEHRAKRELLPMGCKDIGVGDMERERGGGVGGGGAGRKIETESENSI